MIYGCCQFRNARRPVLVVVVVADSSFAICSVVVHAKKVICIHNFIVSLQQEWNGKVTCQVNEKEWKEEHFATSMIIVTGTWLLVRLLCFRFPATWWLQ